jgi:DNA replication protein DnaC
MRTEERWEKIKDKIIKEIFTPRIIKDMLDIPNLPTKELIGQGVFIHGDIRTGKTLLACSMLLEWEKQRYLKNLSGRGVFINSSELFHELKLAFTTGENVTDKYRKNPNLLVLDDLGDSKPSEWARQEFLLILNYRYEHMYPTIFTSNLTLEQLGEYFSDYRIPSRIERMCQIVKKKDWRK